jgi:hypothetical protein
VGLEDRVRLLLTLLAQPVTVHSGQDVVAAAFDALREAVLALLGRRGPGEPADLGDLAAPRRPE